MHLYLFVLNFLALVGISKLEIKSLKCLDVFQPDMSLINVNIYILESTEKMTTLSRKQGKLLHSYNWYLL